MKKKINLCWDMKTFIPIFLLGILAECAIFSAYRIYPITPKKIILLFVAVCVCATVLSVIPFVQTIVKNIGKWFRNLPQNIKKNKRIIAKHTFIITIISIVSIFGAKFLLYLHPVKIEKYVFPGMFIFTWTILFLVVYGIMYRKAIVDRIELCVFVLIILLGHTFLLAEPAVVGTSWDEGIHYGFSMAMSYDFEPMMTDGEAYILDCVTLPLQRYDTEDYHAWVEEVEEQYSKHIRGAHAACRPTYQKLVYIPSAIILLLARALHLPLLVGVVLGKWGHLLVFATLVYWSMKKLKAGKMIVATIALLPQTLFLASHYSYDTWVLGWIMLGMSCFIYEMQHMEQYIDIKNLSLMVIAFLIGLGPKAIYVPLMMLLLFIPKKKFQSDKQHRIYCIVVIVAMLLVLSTFVIPFISSNGGGAGDSRGGTDVNSSLQTSFILHNIGEYLVICLNFAKKYLAFEDWKSITSFFAYYGHVPFRITSLILLMVVSFTDKCEDDANVKWYHKGIVYVMSFGITLLIITALYISFNPVGATDIEGVQPRYLTPLVFPVLYCVGSAKIKNDMNPLIYRGTILVLSTFITMFAIWTVILCRYF